MENFFKLCGALQNSDGAVKGLWQVSGVVFVLCSMKVLGIFPCNESSILRVINSQIFGNTRTRNTNCSATRHQEALRVEQAQIVLDNQGDGSLPNVSTVAEVPSNERPREEVSKVILYGSASCFIITTVVLALGLDTYLRNKLHGISFQKDELELFLRYFGKRASSLVPKSEAKRIWEQLCKINPSRYSQEKGEQLIEFAAGARGDEFAAELSRMIFG
tara:strand:- start:364 stop:1017 length:654 start_codon:yes stop_codon:yes gene_type:complete